MEGEKQIVHLRVNLEKLQTIICRLIDEQIKECGSNEIILKNDYYWKFAGKDKYDFAKIPKPDDFHVGSLAADIELTANIDTTDEIVALYSLTEVGEILCALGEDSVSDL